MWTSSTKVRPFSLDTELEYFNPDREQKVRVMSKEERVMGEVVGLTDGARRATEDGSESVSSHFVPVSSSS